MDASSGIKIAGASVTGGTLVLGILNWFLKYTKNEDAEARFVRDELRKLLADAQLRIAELVRQVEGYQLTNRSIHEEMVRVTAQLELAEGRLQMAERSIEEGDRLRTGLLMRIEELEHGRLA